MKTTYDTYLRYEELTQTLHSLADENPNLCKVESIGKSYEGRDIWLMELTNAETGLAVEKPAFWVDGNTHAGEVTGSMAALYLIETLLEGYGSDERIKGLLDGQSFYVLPRLSPDGAERYLTMPYTLRESMRPWPELEEEPGLARKTRTATATYSRCASRTRAASGAPPKKTRGSWSREPRTSSGVRTTDCTGRASSRTTTASSAR
jgi:murein tripeptide amidase MpaA